MNLRQTKRFCKRTVPITQYEKCELDENHGQKYNKNPARVIGCDFDVSMPSVARITRVQPSFEIAFNEFFPQMVLVRLILSTKILLEILLLQVVPQFTHRDLPEVEGQWQRLGRLADRNAVPGQVAE